MMNIKKIEVNVSTYFFIILCLFSGFMFRLPYLLLIFLVHELGHILFCFFFKVNILKLEIYPFGGVFQIDKDLNIEIYKDFLISFGGILFQIIFFFINRFLLKNTTLEHYNLLFLSVNLLPIIPFDGSKLILITLSKFISFYYSYIFYFFFSIFTDIILLINHPFFSYNSLSIVIFSIYFIYKEIRDFPLIFNKFLMERFLNKYNLNKQIYINKNNLIYLRRGKECFFLVDSYENEYKLLSKKFDNSSYIW